MNTTPDAFLVKVRSGETLIFSDTMKAIAKYYRYRPARFWNGLGKDRFSNEAGTNEGSCMIFAFGQLHGLSEAETLALFGEHYRDVLNDPSGEGHKNIRTFMRHGWPGIEFETTPLVESGQVSI